MAFDIGLLFAVYGMKFCLRFPRIEAMVPFFCFMGSSIRWIRLCFGSKVECEAEGLVRRSAVILPSTSVILPLLWQNQDLKRPLS